MSCVRLFLWLNHIIKVHNTVPLVRLEFGQPINLKFNSTEHSTTEPVFLKEIFEKS